MDLRRRLVGFLGMLLLGLLLTAVLINLYSLRSDISTEVIASEQLVKVLLETGRIEPDLPPAEAATRLTAILNSGPLRHLSISTDELPLPENSISATNRLAEIFGIEPANAGQRVRLGNQTLHIAPNPASEIEERLGDTVRLCITLLLFSGATLLVAWWSAERALVPFRDLEAGLKRLAGGDKDAALPAFALREFKQVAGAINDLAAALATSHAAQRRLSRQLIQVQEEERRTLARDLHDEMGQTLTAIGVTAAYLQRNAEQLDAQRVIECAQDLRRDVRTSGKQLRDMLKRLRPHGLDAPGLASALRELLTSWQQRESGISFKLELPENLPPLGEDVGLVLYRVVQEALTNVVRHSGATHCRVNIEVTAEALRLRIEDDGNGLPPNGLPRQGGLLGIEERLHMVDSRLEIRAGEPKGLNLQISMPLTELEQQEKI